MRGGPTAKEEALALARRRTGSWGDMAMRCALAVLAGAAGAASLTMLATLLLWLCHHGAGRAAAKLAAVWRPSRAPLPRLDVTRPPKCESDRTLPKQPVRKATLLVLVYV